MWKRLVAAQFDHFGVDHQHPYFVRPSGHQDRRNDRVQADTFACSRSPRDQQVRQRRQVCHQWIARDVFAKVKRDSHLFDTTVDLFDDVTQADDLALLVRDFNADSIFTGNRCHDPYTGNAQGNRQIVSQSGDL